MQEAKVTKGSATRTATRALRRRAGVVASAAALLCAGTVLWMPSQAWAESDAVKALAAPPPIQLPLKPSPEFAKFPRYVGTLGARPIVLRLGPKTDDPSGVHGEYQYTDSGEVILIAGDRDGDTLEVEESNDGTHITGNWVGKFAADGSLEGDRMRRRRRAASSAFSRAMATTGPQSSASRSRRSRDSTCKARGSTAKRSCSMNATYPTSSCCKTRSMRIARRTS